jgi:glycosyltransferase involved in cell wall biosynthesis
MNIVMIMSVFGLHAIGGAERTAGVLAANLARRGHQVSILTLGMVGSSISHGLNDAGVTVWQIPLAQIYDPYGLDGSPKQGSVSAFKKAVWHLIDVYNPVMARDTGRVLASIKPDIVMTHTLQGFSVSVWNEVKKTGAKLVHMTHDHALICPSTAMTKGAKVCERPCLQCSVYGRMRNALARVPDVVVGPSRIILDRHQKFGWFERVSSMRVIPNALPNDWPRSDGPLVPHRPMVFGFLGRLDESKGIDTLLAALKQLPVDSYKVKVGGSGDGMKARERWLDASVPFENVEFLGVVNSAQFMTQIDVLITPSRAHETFCNVVMEAGCLGRPAIVSDRGALPERVMHGQCGWIFSAGDEIQLARVMGHCIANPGEVVSKGALALQSRANYEAENQCDQFESLYQELMA